MEWFATYSAGILRGSLSDADDTIQLIWIKLMAMANEAKNPDSGRLEFAPGKPYPLSYIATICMKTEGELRSAIDEFKADISLDGTPRVAIDTDGTLVLNNWGRHQCRAGRVVKKKDNHNSPEDNKKLHPNDEESRKLRAKSMTRSLSYQNPEDAGIGKSAREFDDHIDALIKQRNTDPETGEIIENNG